MDPQQVGEQVVRVMDALVVELYDMGEQKSCIGAGAVLMNTLHQIGFSRAYPLTVRVMVFNPKATQQLVSVGWKMDAVTPDEDAFCISIGEPHDSFGPEIWPGHLAVIVPNALGEKHLLLDPTIIQANHPGHQISLPPLVAPVMDDFTSGAKQRRISIKGSTLLYSAFPDDKSYQEKSNWDKLISSTVVVDRVLKRLNRG